MKLLFITFHIMSIFVFISSAEVVTFFNRLRAYDYYHRYGIRFLSY